MVSARVLLPLVCALAACSSGTAPGASAQLPPILLVIAPAPSAQPTSSSVQAPRLTSKDLASDWSGTWVGDRGYEYTFRLHVSRKARGSQEVDGWFEYTLTRTPLSERIGEVGREYVRGRYDETTRELTLRGYRTDSPGFLALDEYRLEIGATGRSLSGRARGNSYRWECRLQGRATR